MTVLNRSKKIRAWYRSKHGPLTWGLALMFQIIVVTGAAAQNGPSFHCRYVSPTTEYLIGEDSELWRCDLESSDTYRDILNRVFGQEARRVRTQQKAWLGVRDSCGDCFDWVRTAYVRRIDNLNVPIDRISGDGAGVSYLNGPAIFMS